MSRVAMAWAEWMAAMSIQIVVVVAAAALLERLLARRVRPGLASALWLVALAKLVTPPTLGSPLSVVPGIPGAALSTPSAFALAAFWIWLAGVAAFGTAAVVRHLRTRRALLAGSTASDHPSVRVVPGLEVPCVLGYWRPVVLIPPGRVPELALLHEFTHVRRRDPLMGLAALAIQVVYWFHPAAWLIRSRLATLREVGCDADVARGLGARTTEYRRLLAEVGLKRDAAATGVALGGGRLVERLEWLAARKRTTGRFAAPLAALLALAACVPLAPTPAPPFTWPTLEQTHGCLQRRFVVLEAMARQP